MDNLIRVITPREIYESEYAQKHTECMKIAKKELEELGVKDYALSDWLALGTTHYIQWTRNMGYIKNKADEETKKLKGGK